MVRATTCWLEARELRQESDGEPICRRRHSLERQIDRNLQGVGRRRAPPASRQAHPGRQREVRQEVEDGDCEAEGGAPVKAENGTSLTAKGGDPVEVVEGGGSLKAGGGARV